MAERLIWAQSHPFCDQRAGGASTVDRPITLHSFLKLEPETDAKISGILAVAIALIAAGKLSATVSTCNQSTIKDTVAHLRWRGKPLLDAGQM